MFSGDRCNRWQPGGGRAVHCAHQPRPHACSLEQASPLGLRQRREECAVCQCHRLLDGTIRAECIEQ